MYKMRRIEDYQRKTGIGIRQSILSPVPLNIRGYINFPCSIRSSMTAVWDSKLRTTLSIKIASGLCLSHQNIREPAVISRIGFCMFGHLHCLKSAQVVLIDFLGGKLLVSGVIGSTFYNGIKLSLALLKIVAVRLCHSIP